MSGGSSNRPTSPERLCKRSFVKIVKLTADWKTMCQLAEPNRESLQAFGNIMSRCLTFECRVHCKHDLIDATLRNSADELIDCEVLRPNSVERGKATSEDMI